MTQTPPSPETSPATAPRRVAQDKVTGVLEVGCNDTHEVVINHPDLQPDENGVGHIVFSPAQALELAKTLAKQAGLAIKARYEEEEKKRIASVPPVDRNARVLLTGQKEEEKPDYRELRSDGQQKDYVVLSPEERAKGFVRPVRRSYLHVGPPATPNTLRALTDEEKKRYAPYGYVKFEEYPSNPESSVTGKFWSQAELDRAGRGCGTRTTMGKALAETYARDPKFYSGTFCVGCSKHFPLEEFVWLDNPGERLGT